MAANRPDVWFGLALNRDPNDATTAPVWSDWTRSLLSVSDLERGRDHELDVSMAAEPTILLRDPDEYLNPANPSSPYAGLVQPFREACMVAQWPNTPAGGAVNLLNSGTWRGNNVAAVDPSFESYTVGAGAPNWMTAIGGVTPLVANTSPFQGSKNVRFAVATSSNRQGVSWPVACIPGRQYTASVYVRQSVANTLRLDVTDQVWVGDPFDGRTVASGWGNAFGPGVPGPAWTDSGGVHADYAASAGTGRHSVATLGVTTRTLMTGPVDMIFNYRVQVPQVSTGVAAQSGFICREDGANNNFYIFRTLMLPTGRVELLLSKRVAGVETTIADPAGDQADYTPGTWTWVRGQVDGPNFYMSCWKDGTLPPSTPQLTLTGETTFTAAGRMGLRSDLPTGWTGALPMVFGYDDVSVIGAVTGTSTTTTGAYVRLSVTWTATAPQHTIRIGTIGAVTADNVDIDATQHEQAAAASAFTTAGPVIYPIFRNLMERPVRVWRSRGFEGFVEAPCVDGFAALNSIKIDTEYTQAVMGLAPAYYWRLNDGTSTLQFADTSGLGRSPLYIVVSKYGAGTLPQPGGQLEIPGDPGAAGVTFTTQVTQAGSIIGCGGAGAVPGGIVVPAAPGGPAWGATMSAWINYTDNANSQDVVRMMSRAGRGFMMSTGPGSVVAAYGVVGVGGGQVSVIPSTSVRDGLPHHMVATVVQDSTNTTVTVYVDGVATSSTASTASVGGIIPTSFDSFQAGGIFSSYSGSYGAVANGTVAHAAVWGRALSTGEVSALYAAGKTAFAGETTGARILRHLALGSYSGPTRVSAGATTMQPASWTGRKDLLTDSQETTVAEQGTFWIAPDGAAVMESRQDRWLRLTPRVVFGEDAVGSEVPYLDDVRLDPDPLYIFADVLVGRANGATFAGGAAVDVATATRRFFARSYEATVDVATDQQAQDMADFVFNTHDGVMLRVDTLTLDPASNPALWPVVLALEVGWRVQFKRRAKAANAGAGLTISLDFFVEKIGQPKINFETGEWTVTAQLSPINAGANPSMQPWILEDTTYGVLDSTTILGW